MNKKRIGILICFLLMITFFSSSSTVTATNKIEPSSDTTYNYGAFVLTCSDIEGMNTDYHVGGLSDLDFTATSEQFIIATLPMWGTTIIENQAEIHITIENFLGVIQTRSCGQIQIVGLCKNIAWELI
jgi:hypothetical protein